MSVVTFIADNWGAVALAWFLGGCVAFAFFMASQKAAHGPTHSDPSRDSRSTSSHDPELPRG